VSPRTLVQTCIEHLIRYSLSFACWGREIPNIAPIAWHAAQSRFAIKFEDRFTIDD
jgi:transposase-like protein